VSIHHVVASPDPLSPTSSTHSVTKTLDPKSPVPPATLAETEETPEKTDTPKLATDGYIQFEFSPY
jgi:hypothetical protein